MSKPLEKLIRKFRRGSLSGPVGSQGNETAVPSSASTSPASPSQTLLSHPTLANPLFQSNSLIQPSIPTLSLSHPSLETSLSPSTLSLGPLVEALLPIHSLSSRLECALHIVTTIRQSPSLIPQSQLVSLWLHLVQLLLGPPLPSSEGLEFLSPSSPSPLIESNSFFTSETATIAYEFVMAAIKVDNGHLARGKLKSQMIHDIGAPEQNSHGP